ncbi:MAG TPA: transposase [Rubrobacteraceae bacterium]|nr:transposase [Rubrobacteraceae bacterium]
MKEIVEGRGCELMYLPPYSPDFNPIEQVATHNPWFGGLLATAILRPRR